MLSRYGISWRKLGRISLIYLGLFIFALRIDARWFHALFCKLRWRYCLFQYLLQDVPCSWMAYHLWSFIVSIHYRHAFGKSCDQCSQYIDIIATAFTNVMDGQVSIVLCRCGCCLWIDLQQGLKQRPRRLLMQTYQMQREIPPSSNFVIVALGPSGNPYTCFSRCSINCE